MNRWYPHCATRKHRPEPGDIIPRDHAVWRVTDVRDVERTSEEAADFADQVADRAKHGQKAWDRPPYQVVVTWVGGVPPRRVSAKGTYAVRVPADTFQDWNVYPDGRWPQCSCCGEPMPCQAEIQDRQVDAAMDRIDEMSKRLPGCCWGCGDPISSRQQAVLYVGENMDLPGGPDVRFHLRASCYSAATRYEEKWLSVDHSRLRLLTYPKCGGSLWWHADGSSECSGGGHADPECQGARSHTHGHHATCRYMPDGCPRGCPPVGHGCGTGNGRRRIEIRDPDLPQGILPDPPAALDRRQPCPGHLLLHRDGTSECIAGGRDDCWGGDQFRHETKRPCHTQSHGCGRCDVVGGV